ncbi:hypothetical protein C8R45DRAFT_1222072 [Mycena sanguinolenta]|nr:hypothetical protein C8R45DRAFT_1222072 [Mycena sanguinolenta]
MDDGIRHNVLKCNNANHNLNLRSGLSVSLISKHPNVPDMDGTLPVASFISRGSSVPSGAGAQPNGSSLHLQPSIRRSACLPLSTTTTVSQPATVLPTPHNPHPTCNTPHTMSSTASNASSYSLASPLPSPVSPSSLTVETPSLGDTLLPRPKRGAPPVAPAPKKKDQKKDENAPLDPALCEGW